MGFLSGIVSTTIKTALTPFAVLKDVAEVASGGDADNTKKLLNDAKRDAVEAIDDLVDGEL